MTKKELAEIRDKLSDEFSNSLGHLDSHDPDDCFSAGFNAFAEIFLRKLEHAEKMKNSHWESLENSYSNIECLEKNVHELLEEKATLKAIIKDYEEALEFYADKNNWVFCSEFHGVEYFTQIKVSDRTEIYAASSYGGVKAREVLNKHRGNE